MAETDNIEVLRAGCFFCHVRCGVLVTKKNGRIVDIKGDPDCPHNKGFVCSRLDKKRYLDGFVYNPNRLKRPLKRAGERGGGKWEEITWDDAVAEIARKVKDTRDATFVETENGLTVNYTPGIASLGGSQENSEEEYLILKAMRSLGIIAIDNQARV